MASDIERASIHFEAIKIGMNKAGTVLELGIHPDQVPYSIQKDKAWTRYVCVLVKVDDNDNPVVPVERQEVDTAVAQAGMLCKNSRFQLYMVMQGHADEESEQSCAEGLRSALGIKSRSALRTNGDAREKFKEITYGFERFLQGRPS